MYAYIVNGFVHEVFSIPTSLTLAECREPNFADACVEVQEGQDVQPGWAWDGEQFAPPQEAGPNAQAIKSRLADLDARSSRPLRAILHARMNGQDPDSADTARLADLENQALVLRGQLAGLD